MNKTDSDLITPGLLLVGLLIKRVWCHVSTDNRSLTYLNARRLSGKYGCQWNPEICTKEPVHMLLGPDCCRSMCTNMKKDVFNCGVCGHICFYGSICCNGACIDIFNNHRHCGGCYNTCPTGSKCQYGMCDYT